MFKSNYVALQRNTHMKLCTVSRKLEGNFRNAKILLANLLENFYKNIGNLLWLESGNPSVPNSFVFLN